MIPRWVLDTNGLRVSMPGNDVLSTGIGGMAFDSAYGSGLVAWATGTCYAPAATGDGPGNGYVYFPATPPAVPLVLAQATRYSDNETYGGNYRHVHHTPSDPAWLDPNEYDKVSDQSGMVYACDTTGFSVSNFDQSDALVTVIIFLATYA